jgi:NitT/TauT family transport system substrate-binding protein
MGLLATHNFPMPSRRAFLSWTGAAACAPGLPACDSLFDLPISVASHVWVGYEPMFLARDKGWLNPQQAQLLETSSAIESLRALKEGKVQGAALTLDEMLCARADGVPLSLVLIFDISAGADMLVVRHGIKTLADLKGQRIGYEKSSVGQLMLAEILKEARLTPEDIRRQHLSVDQHSDAWDRHQVDALITYEPVASQLLAKGAVRLFDSRQIPNTIIDVLALRSDVLDYRHASAVKHLLISHFRALDHIKRNPQDAAYRMTRHLKLPPADVLQAFKGLMLPDAANNYRLLSGAKPEILINVAKLSSTMVQSKLLPKEDTLVNLIRADFLPPESLEN